KKMLKEIREKTQTLIVLIIGDKASGCIRHEDNPETSMTYMPHHLARLLVCIALLSGHLRAAEADPAKPIKVLFIGNSLTFYNKLPEMTKFLAAHAPKPLAMDVDSHTVGG